MTNPIEQLQSVLNCAKAYHSIDCLSNDVRMAHESPFETFKRLKEERFKMIQLLTEHGLILNKVSSSERLGIHLTWSEEGLIDRILEAKKRAASVLVGK